MCNMQNKGITLRYVLEQDYGIAPQNFFFIKKQKYKCRSHYIKRNNILLQSFLHSTCIIILFGKFINGLLYWLGVLFLVF